MLEQSLINYFARVGGQLVIDQASGAALMALPVGGLLDIGELGAYLRADLAWEASQTQEKPAD